MSRSTDRPMAERQPSSSIGRTLRPRPTSRIQTSKTSRLISATRSKPSSGRLPSIMGRGQLRENGLAKATSDQNGHPGSRKDPQGQTSRSQFRSNIRFSNGRRRDPRRREKASSLDPGERDQFGIYAGRPIHGESLGGSRQGHSDGPLAYIRLEVPDDDDLGRLRPLTL